MIELLMILIGFVLLLLVIIWKHFIVQPKQPSLNMDSRDKTNIALYHEHKAEIENDLKQGNIDQENYQYLITELDQSLLQDLAHASKAQELNENKRTLGIVWPAILSVFIILFSFYFYSQNGAYQLITTTPRAQAPDQQATSSAQQQAIERVQALQALTTNEPKNSDAWYGLGQALVAVGDFNGAQHAFDTVMALEGEQADLYGAKAQAAYYHHNQKITPQVQEFIDQALSIDAADPSTNILLGMNEFMQQQYEMAITYWQRVVNDNRDNVNIAALEGAISEAKSRLSMQSNEAAGDVKNDDVNTIAGPQLVLNVKLSEEIKRQLVKSQDEDKVVFIYAIPTSGQRIPVAAIKMRASDLPVQVVLNDSQAMTPQAKLSDVEQVHVYAVVSASGGAGIKSGDFKAEYRNVNVDTQSPVTLTIDSVVE